MDEWGTWHLQATVEAGLYQQNTLRDAILAAVVLNLFNRYSSRLSMANLAQTVNVLQSLCLTKGEQTILTPTYHVYDMYQTHMGGAALKVEVQSPIIREPLPTPLSPRAPTRTLKPLHAIDASASLSPNGRRLTITLVNQSLDAVETEIRLVGGRAVEQGDVRVLTASDIRDHNDFDAPNTVAPQTESVKMKGPRIIYEAPKHAISAFILHLQ